MHYALSNPVLQCRKDVVTSLHSEKIKLVLNFLKNTLLIFPSTSALMIQSHFYLEHHSQYLKMFENGTNNVELKRAVSRDF